MTVWIYVNTSKQVGDPDHLKVFANVDAAETWFEENDPEGVAFEYDHEKRARRVAQARSRLDHPVRPDNAVIHSGAYGNGLNAVRATYCRASRSPRMRRGSARTTRGPTSPKLFGASSDQPVFENSSNERAASPSALTGALSAMAQRSIDDRLDFIFRPIADHERGIGEHYAKERGARTH